MELYIHIPFCARKCAYCDFLSFPADEDTKEAYARALIREIHLAREPLGKRITSVFFGGGTPSLLPAQLTVAVLEELGKRYVLSSDAEISMEVNPGTVSSQSLKLWHRAGINRLSIGLQSPRDEELRMLGRIHSFAQFKTCFAMAREAGFGNLNLDLMFGLPGQSCQSWEESLRLSAAFAPEHISAYSLIIEEGTPFARMRLQLPDEDTEYEMYDMTDRVLSEYGYRQYEISNYSLPGRECRHNLGYWEREEYLGFGLGAASLVGHTRFSNTRSLKEYLAADGDPRICRKETEVLTESDEMAEFVFLGMRKRKGIRDEDFQSCFGRSIWEVYAAPLKKYLTLGLISCEGGSIALTRPGIHVSNRVFSDFLQ